MNPPIDASPASDPLRDPALYSNRELSQLNFNFRVLAQAQDTAVPLLERLRYLCISCTNLDEFFEIRAATVRHAQDFGVPVAADGAEPLPGSRAVRTQELGSPALPRDHDIAVRVQVRLRRHDLADQMGAALPQLA